MKRSRHLNAEGAEDTEKTLPAKNKTPDCSEVGDGNFAFSAISALQRSGDRGGRDALGALDHRVHGRGGLGALRDPVVDAVELDGQHVALGARVVGADLLDGVTIAAGALLGHDHTVVRFVLGADAGKTDFECHLMYLVA